MFHRIRRLAVDLALVAAATILAFALRENFEFSSPRWAPAPLYLGNTLFFAAILLPTAGTYRGSWRHSSMPDFVRIVYVSALVVIGALFSTFVMDRLAGIARAVPVIQLVLLPVALVGTRVFFQSYRKVRKEEHRFDPSAAVVEGDAILVAGLNPITELYLRCAHRYGHGRLPLAGILTDKSTVDRNLAAYGLPVRGTIAEAEQVISQLEIEGIYVRRLVVTAPRTELSEEQLEAITKLAASSELQIEFIAEILGLDEKEENASSAAQNAAPSLAQRLSIDRIESSARRSYWQSKRVVDVVLASILLIVLSPLFVMLYLGTLVTMGAPVFFTQHRPGRHGRVFRVLKFRSMCAPFDRDGNRIPDAARESRFGRFVRSKRLDELPQLINVLKGDMSFIGPRPLVAREQQFVPFARLAVRPGVTGWAQVTGGRAVSIADKTALDLWYIYNASFALDLKILFATFRFVLKGERVDLDAVETAWAEVGTPASRPLAA